MYTRFFGSIETLENRIAIRDIESVENWFPSENKLKTSPPIISRTSSFFFYTWAVSSQLTNGKKAPHFQRVWLSCGMDVVCASLENNSAYAITSSSSILLQSAPIGFRVGIVYVIKTKQRPQPPSKWPKHPLSPRVMSDCLLLLALTNS